MSEHSEMFNLRLNLDHLPFFFLIYFLLHWVFVAARAFSSWGERGLLFLAVAGSSLQWLLLLWLTGSRRAGFSSCGAQAYLLHGMWDLSGPGIEPMSPALAGGFLTTVPPGKSRTIYLWLSPPANPEVESLETYYGFSSTGVKFPSNLP